MTASVHVKDFVQSLNDWAVVWVDTHDKCFADHRVKGVLVGVSLIIVFVEVPWE